MHHEPKVKKRDGTLVPFDRERIAKAITKAGQATGEFNATAAHGLTAQALRVIKTRRRTDEIADIERIQDIVEQTLIDAGFIGTARAYIVYRSQHQTLRKDKKTLVNVGAAMNEYLEREDWRVSANANQGYSLGGLILNTAGKVTANYWLNHVYSPEIGEAHREGDLHIHDLDLLAPYCAGWSLRTLLNEGFNGVPGKVEAKPPKHMSSAVGQIVNFLGTLQNEWAGAQAFSSFDTYMAPFIRVDGLDYPRVRQYIQELIYNLNVPSRWGCVDTETEVLSTDGFKRYNELRERDNIYSWKDGELVINPVNKVVIKPYRGDMHAYLGRGYIQQVTPEHRVLTYKHNSFEPEIRRSEEIFNVETPYKLPAMFVSADTQDANISDAKIVLAAMIYTEGSIEYRNGNLHRITFHKSENRWGSQEFEDACAKLGFQYRPRVAHGAFGDLIAYRLYAEAARQLESLVGAKGIINEIFTSMSMRQSDLFLKTWCKLDGSGDKMELQYDNEGIRDQLQHIAVRAGYTTFLKSRKKTNYVKLRKVRGVVPKERIKVEYDGLVWCPSVDAGTAVFRKNGSIFISGQSQSPFSNLTFDLVCPEDLADNVPLIGGKEVDFCYGDLQEEMDMINRAYIEVMTEGDAKGRVFTFPIPTYNITPDFDWGTPIADLLFEMTAKYGIPYFQNFLNSDLKPNMVRSMCPLHPDTEVVVRSSKRKLVTVQTIGDLAKNEAKGSNYEVLYEGEWIPASTNIQSSTRCRTFVIKNGTKVTMDDRHEQICKRKRGAETETLPAKKLKVGYYVPFNGTACSGNLENHDAGYAVGAYLGDGSYDNGGLVYSLSKDKEHVVLAMCGFFEHLGYTVVVERGDRELVSVKVSRHNAASRTWMQQFVSGENALEKRLTSRCWSLGPQFLQGILDGWYDTNGGNRGRIYTASVGLIDDFSVLSGLLGKAYKVDREGDTRVSRLGINPVYTLKTHKRGAYKGEFFYEDGMWWFPISAIEQSDYAGSVYCLEVDHEDHLFQLANGMVTHNCRLQLDLGELLKRGNGLFGSAEQTGSLGVVTVNCARLGYRYAGEWDNMIKALDRLLELARDSLEVKRKTIQKYMDNGLFPYTKRYLGTLRNHFSTIGVNGINEMLENYSEGGSDLTERDGIHFGLSFLDHIRARLAEFQEETGHMYNLEATPAEGTTYRFAREDQKRFPDITQAGTKERPYYTNSSQLPVGYTDDPFKALALQEPLQGKYTGGTVMHLYLGERMTSGDACKALVKRSLEGFRIPYITVTPTFSICPIHGYIAGDHEYCPECDAELLAKKEKSA